MTYQEQLAATGAQVDRELAAAAAELRRSTELLGNAQATIRELTAENERISEDLRLEQEWRTEHMRTVHGPQLPTIMPLSAQAVHAGYGVCQHINFAKTVYKHQAALLDRLGAMSVGRFRTRYPAKRTAGLRTAVERCRRHGMRMHLLVADRSTTKAEIEATVAAAVVDADVIESWEGINEPNGDGWSPATAAATVDRQRWLHSAVRSHPEFAHTTVYSCSMHDVQLDRSDGQHWRDVAALGIGDYCDAIAVHGYQAGLPPGREPKLGQRVRWVREAFPDMPMAFTEFGWTNATGPEPRTGGHEVTSERASAAYDVQAVLYWARSGITAYRYEALNDPTPDRRITEADFGWWRVESVDGNPETTWTPKPAVSPLTELLGWLDDPGEPYIPTTVHFDINRVDLEWVAVQKRDGTTRLWVWNPAPIWDPVRERDAAEQLLEVTVTHAAGAHTFRVGAMPVAVDLPS